MTQHIMVDVRIKIRSTGMCLLLYSRKKLPALCRRSAILNCNYLDASPVHTMTLVLGFRPEMDVLVEIHDGTLLWLCHSSCGYSESRPGGLREIQGWHNLFHTHASLNTLSISLYRSLSLSHTHTYSLHMEKERNLNRAVSTVLTNAHIFFTV